jgi:hypothetical protein
MLETIHAWAAEVIAPEMIKGRSVLEVGSRNVNGSLRELVTAMEPSFYLGVDIEEGEGVDELCPAEEVWRRPGWGNVISTEMLEHVENWRAALLSMQMALHPGGWMFLTTCMPGFRRHDHPGDYWRFTPDFMRQAFGGFDVLDIRRTTETVMVVAHKPDYLSGLEPEPAPDV